MFYFNLLVGYSLNSEKCTRENSISLWTHYHKLVENGRSFLLPKSCKLPEECMKINDPVELSIFLLFTISGTNSTSRMLTLLF